MGTVATHGSSELARTGTGGVSSMHSAEGVRVIDVRPGRPVSVRSCVDQPAAFGVGSSPLTTRMIGLMAYPLC